MWAYSYTPNTEIIKNKNNQPQLQWNNTRSHNNWLKQIKHLVPWHPSLGPLKAELEEPVIYLWYMIISGTKREAGKWRGDKPSRSFCGHWGTYSTGTSWETNCCLPELFSWTIVGEVFFSWFTSLIIWGFSPEALIHSPTPQPRVWSCAWGGEIGFSLLPLRRS